MTRSALTAGLAAMLAVATIACGGSPSSSSSPPPFKTIESGKLTIATYGSAPPLITVGPGANDIGGLSGGWAKEFAKEYGLEIKLFQTTFASTLVAVEQGKADIGAPVYYNSDRAKKYYYTYPVDNEALVVFTKKDFAYNGPASLKGHKVATVTGYVWTPFFKTFFGNSLQLYAAASDAKTAFMNGQVEAYLDADINYFSEPLSLSPQLALHTVNAGDFGIPGDIISNKSYWIVNCNEKDLGAAMNKTRERLESSGKWKQIVDSDGAPPGTPQQIPALELPQTLC
jgi:ABC-type amino acid transport substrate-binding protein